MPICEWNLNSTMEGPLSPYCTLTKLYEQEGRNLNIVVSFSFVWESLGGNIKARKERRKGEIRLANQPHDSSTEADPAREAFHFQQAVLQYVQLHTSYLQNSRKALMLARNAENDVYIFSFLFLTETDVEIDLEFHFRLWFVKKC